MAHLCNVVAFKVRLIRFKDQSMLFEAIQGCDAHICCLVQHGSSMNQWDANNTKFCFVRKTTS